MPEKEIDIAAVLTAATNLQVTADDVKKPQEFFTALALAVNKLPDDKWEKLPLDAKDWSNAASEAVKSKTAIAEIKFSHLVADDKDVPKPSTKPAGTKVEPATTGRAKQRNLWGEGTVAATIHEMLIDDGLTDLNPTSLVNRLRKAGVKKVSVSTVEASISHFMRVFGAMRRKGWLAKSAGADAIVKKVEAANDAL